MTLVQTGQKQNFNNNTTTDHIDRNRNNNKVDNLRWATSQEQTENRYIP